MKRRITSMILLLLGLLTLMYPTISNWWNTRVANLVMSQHNDSINSMDYSEVEKMKADAAAYNEALIGNVVPDAFMNSIPRDLTYESLLNLNNDGFIGSVEIPKININIPIYHYTTEEVLEKGAGHLAGSSLPIGGESTHSIISAHRGLPSAKLFTDLDRVEEGDTFYLYVLGDILAYQVDLIKVIEPTNTEDLSIVLGEDYCTLFTCTPYAVNSHRLLVRGTRIPYTEQQHDLETKKTSRPSFNAIFIRVLCVLFGLLTALLVITLDRRSELVNNAKLVKRIRDLQNKKDEQKE